MCVCVYNHDLVCSCYLRSDRNVWDLSAICNHELSYFIDYNIFSDVILSDLVSAAQIIIWSDSNDCLSIK